jgi:hypothetical protein
VSITFHELAMLCAFGAVAFATETATLRPGVRRAFAWPALAAGFGVTTWASAATPIDASWAGGLVGVVAGWQLARPGRGLLLLAAAGGAAGLWGALLHAQGVPRPAAVGIAAALPIVSAYLSTATPAFAPPLLREEATLGVLLLAVAVSVSPTIAQGWHSALALNLTGNSATPALLPVWLMSFVSASVALGGLWALWRRG